jgi:predicted nuclease with RNAse H fold
MAEQVKYFGMDYGSKQAGTTCICYLLNNEIVIEQSEKKKDADKFIEVILNKYMPEIVFIDAPLSLPGVYSKPDFYNDYFYRECDREAQAMSPMFLGGLTARAMKLNSKFPSIKFIESYPKLVSKNLIGNNYKKIDISLIESMLEEKFELKLNFNNFHQIDSFLCWTLGERYLNHNISSIGNKEEGLIFF